MTYPARELVGRENELARLNELVLKEFVNLAVVYGPSGIGKTKLVEEFADSASVGSSFSRVIFQTVYRTGWIAALSQVRDRLGLAPPNSTVRELESALIALAESERLLFVLDNVEEANVDDVQEFAERWKASVEASCLLITAQQPVRAVLPVAWHDLKLSGLTSDDDLLELLGELKERLPIEDLRAVARALGGNPQYLLFLRWLEPASVVALQESAAKLLDRQTVEAVDELVEHASLPALFFLALGVHKDLSVADTLLAALWDHFGSRGAEPFLRSLSILVERKFLTPTRANVYRMHESVHVSLPKALRHRIGEDRVPSLHHYFAEYYRRDIRRNPTSTGLAHFTYHSRAAADWRLLYDTLISEGVARDLAALGTTVQVRTELEDFHEQLAASGISQEERIRLYTTLGQLCNDLSDHSAALDYTDRCAALLASVPEGSSVHGLQRDMWYIRAVASSNTGKSDACLRNYYRIVLSAAPDDNDPKACLSLGYLAHDLKYRDMDTADRLGRLSVEWARDRGFEDVLPKNLCSYAETLGLQGRFEEANLHFREAQVLAWANGNRRESGRILTNWGLSRLLGGQEEVAVESTSQGAEISRELGDRRRYFQGLLYMGVVAVSQGQRTNGRRLLLQATEGFMTLGDGRYFTPGLLWLLQSDNDLPQESQSLENIRPERPDVLRLVEYYKIHGEFNVYRQFWYRYLHLDRGGWVRERHE